MKGNRLIPLLRRGDGSTLSLDFTAMSGLDSRFTFSRTSLGTYIGPDGLLYGADTSTSSQTIGSSGTKTFTLAATAGVNRRYGVGDTVIASSGANNMSGTVTSYDPATQVLVFTATSSSGSGTLASWIIGTRMARFDHDPATLAPRGLLIEGSVTNLVTQSEAFTTGAGNWTDSNITRDGTLRTSPDGTANALRITASAGNATIIRTSAIGTSAARTFSIWLRRVTGTGNIDYTQDNGANWNTQAITSSWVRYTFTHTANHQVGIRIVTSGDAIELWGAQLEAGSGASSYIPTGSGTVQRAADSCCITGANFSSWFNTVGTVLCEHELTNAWGTQDRVQAGFGNYAPGTCVFSLFRTNSTTAGNGIWGSGGTGYQEATQSGYPTRTPIRSGMTFDISTSPRTARAFANGTIATSSASTTGTVSVDRLFLGANGASGTTANRDWTNGHIRSVKFWPIVLSNAQLQALTQ